MIVVAQCEGAHVAQLTGCRRNAAHLRALGVPIPKADGTPSPTHPCARCGTHCTVLFLVRRDVGTRAAAMVDEICRKRLRKLMGDHKASATHPTRVALRDIFTDQGVHACFTCASTAMAESFASQLPSSRPSAITAALTRQAAWMQKRATVSSDARPPLPAVPAAHVSGQRNH